MIRDEKIFGESENEYRVNLDVFEGPLDLLLHLIKKNDLDIYDIPIAFVLEAYMSYIDSLRELNIDLAGDFLLMAAELAHIKSKLLLPSDQTASEEEESDPRADLVRRLLEYQRYRDAAQNLEKRSVLGRDVFIQQAPEELPQAGEGPIDTNVYELIEAFGKMLKRLPAERYHTVAVDRISVNERILQLVDVLSNDVAVTLEELLPPKIARYDVVVTFLALLEMSKLRMLTLYQSGPHGAIYVRRTMSTVGDDEVVRLVKGDEYGPSAT